MPLGAIVFAAAPFVFAGIRAANAQHDLRMFWMALAALAGAAAVAALGLPRGPGRRSLLVRSALVLLVATLLAAFTAYRLGATAALGVWPVAFVLAFCWAAAYAIYQLAQA
jgi:hypothetical protein